MGKKGFNKGPTATPGSQMSVTLREASTGKKHTNTKSSLKLQHIKNLALWASGDTGIPSLGAFFGHHLAASSESIGAPVDPSLFTCQRCESILHPGSNCTIRIEKNNNHARRKGKKATNQPQNNIVYTCHFCSHRNIKRGTPRNISQPKVKPHPKSNSQRTDSTVAKTTTAQLGPTTDGRHRGEMGIVEINSPDRTGTGASGQTTPLTKPTMTLLESLMKKRKRSGSKKKVVPPESSPVVEKSSNRRKRKSWTSLSDIA